MRGENIQYIYTNSKHKNPLCRVVPVLTKEKEKVARSYDKVKYLELLLNATETVLGYFGFDGSVYKPEKRDQNQQTEEMAGRIERRRKKRHRG